jgi:polyisoprenyl-phosphate glycosyltransferase
MKPVYSVVVPCYNEEASLPETHRRITSVMRSMDESYEILYINDGSRDRTHDILNMLADGDAHARVVHFARNAGHQMAVTAGLRYARGEAVVIIDADLQDPPEVIPEMAARWKAGVQVVYGQRRKRLGESAFKKMTARLFYRVLGALTGNRIPPDTGDFRLADRKAVDVINDMPEHARFLRGMFAWVGFRQEPVLYDRDRRFAGETHYPLKKMLRLAVDGIVGFSSKPLIWIVCAGAFWTGTALLAAAVLLIHLLCGHEGGLWWLASLAALLAGNIMLGLGIAGGYIARIYDEARGRPLYIVAEEKGFPDKD